LDPVSFIVLVAGRFNYNHSHIERVDQRIFTKFNALQILRRSAGHVYVILNVFVKPDPARDKHYMRAAFDDPRRTASAACAAETSLGITITPLSFWERGKG
jgi:hypothetical protein